MDEKAKFLGYELTVTRCNDLLSEDGGRRTNGYICFLMPADVAKGIERSYCRNSKMIHKAALLHETDYTIVQRYQAVYRGIYNYFCLATNVSIRMSRIRWILEGSMLKTLANKFRTSVQKIRKRYKARSQDGMVQFQAVIRRDGKKPLIATFGGFHVNRVQAATLPEFNMRQAWAMFSNNRSEVVTRLLNDQCELCGKLGDVEVHHIRKISDIDRPGRRPRADYERIMAARRRKALVVCVACHDDIHAGRYDGPRFR